MAVAEVAVAEVAAEEVGSIPLTYLLEGVVDRFQDTHRFRLLHRARFPAPRETQA